MRRIAVLEYGVGNLHSLARALQAAGATTFTTASVSEAIAADAVVLPGVGAFGTAVTRLREEAAPLRAALRGGLPCLGICLGMQLLFESSEEGEGDGAGLGVVRGTVRRLRHGRIPHMGWNTVHPTDPLLGASGFDAYFANSYVAQPVDAGSVTAWTEYAGQRFPAAVRAGRTVGVQFHPEKSGAAGLALLRRFAAGLP